MRHPWILLGLVSLVAACSGDSSSRGRRTEVVSVPGSIAPANPRTGTEPPPGLQRATALVHQDPSVPDDAIERVLILMPGLLAGASAFDHMGARIVERSGGRVALWAIDRRSNALEDHTGIDAAEAARDPERAKDYYVRGQEIDGRTFEGFVTENGSDVSYLSEWGVRTHVEDLDALVTEAGNRYPNAALFVGGHSLGASLAPIYAAWDFGGRAGFERLSGLVLLEGAPSPSSGSAIPDPGTYEAAVARTRGGALLFSIPFAGLDLYPTAEIIALRASSRTGDPTGLSPDADLVATFFRLLFPLGEVPPATNRAVLGLGFDDEYEPVSFLRTAIGEGVGPQARNVWGTVIALALGAPLSPLFTPTDASFTYDWLPASAMEEPEATDLDTFAELLFAGPSNLIEWYYPARLSLDVGILDALDVRPTGDWRLEAQGLAVTENARVDVPVFAAGGGLGIVPHRDDFEPYRESIAPVLRSGLARADTVDGFSSRIIPGHAHIDTLAARDEGAGNGVFQPLLDWMIAAETLAPPPRARRPASR